MPNGTFRRPRYDAVKEISNVEHRTLNTCLGIAFVKPDRTSNKDIARAAQALAPRVAPLGHIIETPKVYSRSTLDVGCSMLDVFYFWFIVQCLIEYVSLRFTPVQKP